MFAPYELTDDSLAWTEEPAATMMGCPDDLAAQDQWLAELFTTGVGAAADGPTLTLTSDDVTIVLSRAPEADLQELFGKTWSACRHHGRRCDVPDPAGGPYAARGRRPERPGPAGHRVQLRSHHRDRRRHLDHLRAPWRSPGSAARSRRRTIEQRVLAVVDGRSDYVVFDGSVLIVVKGDNGLVFQVR